MEPKLLDAAIRGDIVALHQILLEDPQILEKESVACFTETPLHVAALAGQTDFVKEMIRLMPSFAKDINKKGLTPIHIAAAKGYTEIVTELLSLNSMLGINQCLLRDNNGRIPLHYAVIKGNIAVKEKLIACCSESLEKVTSQDENVLHLAVKCNQVEALKVLVDRLKRLDKLENLLRAKDKEGHHLLELAQAREQLQVLDIVKRYDISSAQEAQGHESNTDMVTDKASITDDAINISVNENALLQKPEADKSTSDSSEALQNVILVAATLIATVSY